jgi:hypothetical protein
MQNYARVFRFGHDLLVPTTIGRVPYKLFLLDAGSLVNFISPAAAREVTKVHGDSDLIVEGISGRVDKVYSANHAILTFGHLRQENQDMTAFDTKSVTRLAAKCLASSASSCCACLSSRSTTAMRSSTSNAIPSASTTSPGSEEGKFSRGVMHKLSAQRRITEKSMAEQESRRTTPLCSLMFAGVYTFAHRRRNQLMTPCKTQLARVCVFLLAAVPAYGQRGELGIDAGQASDKFGGLTRFNGVVGDVYGHLTILEGKEKEGSPDVVAGGEIRFPVDTGHHANEFAVFGGVNFHFTRAFSFGVRGQIRKILVPPSTVQGQVFNRDNIELLQLPIVVEYKFGPGRNLFVRAGGQPEFRPRFRSTSATASSSLPIPGFDHGYTVGGSLGYIFGKWYAKGTYETRYFKFTPSLGNPSGLYNWRGDFVTGGVGILF